MWNIQFNKVTSNFKAQLIFAIKLWKGNFSFDFFVRFVTVTGCLCALNECCAPFTSRKHIFRILCRFQNARNCRFLCLYVCAHVDAVLFDDWYNVDYSSWDIKTKTYTHHAFLVWKKKMNFFFFRLFFSYVLSDNSIPNLVFISFISSNEAKMKTIQNHHLKKYRNFVPLMNKKKGEAMHVPSTRFHHQKPSTINIR